MNELQINHVLKTIFKKPDDNQDQLDCFNQIFGRNKKLNLVIQESFIFVLPLETSISSLPNFSNKILYLQVFASSSPKKYFYQYFSLFFVNVWFKTIFYNNGSCLKLIFHLLMKMIPWFFLNPGLLSCHYVLLTYKQ